VAKRRVIWILSLSFWTAVGLMCGLQIWISMIDHGHEVWRVLLYQVLIWQAWFLFAPVVAWMARRYPMLPPSGRSVTMHLSMALFWAPVHSAWWAMLLVKLRPYDKMNTDHFGSAFWGIYLSGLPQQLIFYCGVLVAHYAVVYYEKYRDRERAAARLEVSLSEARLHALELQIQPHFLFNTLNSISALVRTAHPREAVAMIAGLSELLRYSLEHAGEQRVALSSEVAITERYLEIERLRFPDRMTFALDVPDEVRGAAVPMLLLQPLAENAIRHGVAKLAAPGRVTVRAVREHERLVVEVWNTGALGEDRRGGVGLRNTRARLQHLYGDDHTFELAASGGGVLAKVTVPWSAAS
jgi:two-component system, LytTR family, sensor kinase